MRIAVLRLVFAALVGLASLPSAAQNVLQHANSFTLRGQHVNATFTAGGPGGPQLDFADRTGHRHFAGAELATETTTFGTLVSAIVHRNNDGGATLFTLVVPPVVVAPPNAAHVNTFGFLTLMSPDSASPPFNRGQRDHYTIVPLAGSASYTAF